MPRLGRLHIPGGCYHVMGRGLERRRVFDSESDKKDFLERLGSCLAESQSQCLAWSMMSNHYHLLIRVGSEPLSQLISPLLGGYAGAYNRRHRRSGYVFQNRYKSILCDADSYLLALVRYIHLNPYKAKLVKTLSELDRYRWTGHSGLLGRHEQSWQATDAVLSLFAVRLKTARQRYRHYIEQGMKANCMDLSGGGLIRSYGGWQNVVQFRRDHELRLGDERILGDSDFVERALREDELQMERRTQLERSGWDLETLIERVCQSFELEMERLKDKGRLNEVSMAKALICYWGVRQLGVKTSTLASRLGISQPAVSKSVKRGAEYCREKGLKMEVL